MSRTIKGSKAPGCEYWTSRGGKRWGEEPGRYTKTRTHRYERRQAKADVAERSSLPPRD